MVLQSLINPFKVKKKPWQMFFTGFLYAAVGLLLAYLVFKDIAGILMVFLIVFATIPSLYVTIKNEEELDIQYGKEWFLLKEHGKVLIFLMFLFAGICTSLALLYVVLPSTITSSVFQVQEKAIMNVNQNVMQGTITGNVAKFDLFIKIFINNTKVLFFCLLFSFLYGIGSIFILTWNASVIATAMGSLIKTEIAKTASAMGWPLISSYVSVTAFSIVRYMTHGVFEIAAYFVAGLAGGIISIALIKHNFQDDKIFIDALDLILLSLGLLLVGSIVEVYVTPMLVASL